MLFLDPFRAARETVMNKRADCAGYVDGCSGGEGEEEASAFEGNSPPDRFLVEPEAKLPNFLLSLVEPGFVGFRQVVDTILPVLFSLASRFGRLVTDRLRVSLAELLEVQ